MVAGGVHQAERVAELQEKVNARACPVLPTDVRVPAAHATDKRRV